jgi:hypothetical protein
VSHTRASASTEEARAPLPEKQMWGSEDTRPLDLDPHLSRSPSHTPPPPHTHTHVLSHTARRAKGRACREPSAPALSPASLRPAATIHLSQPSLFLSRPATAPFLSTTPALRPPGAAGRPAQAVLARLRLTRPSRPVALGAGGRGGRDGRGSGSGRTTPTPTPTPTHLLLVQLQRVRPVLPGGGSGGWWWRRKGRWRCRRSSSSSGQGEVRGGGGGHGLLAHHASARRHGRPATAATPATAQQQQGGRAVDRRVRWSRGQHGCGRGLHGSRRSNRSSIWGGRRHRRRPLPPAHHYHTTPPLSPTFPLRPQRGQSDRLVRHGLAGRHQGVAHLP